MDDILVVRQRYDYEYDNNAKRGTSNGTTTLPYDGNGY